MIIDNVKFQIILLIKYKIFNKVIDVRYPVYLALSEISDALNKINIL